MTFKVLSIISISNFPPVSGKFLGKKEISGKKLIFTPLKT